MQDIPPIIGMDDRQCKGVPDYGGSD